MTHPIIKALLPWIIIITGIIIVYSLFYHRTDMTNENLQSRPQDIHEQSPEQQKQVEQQQALGQAKVEHLEQEKIIKQRLTEEFENAFLKQYTQPVGCENWENESHMVRCINHQIKAKQEFKQEFIEKRGLPKDTFDHAQLRFTE